MSLIVHAIELLSLMHFLMPEKCKFALSRVTMISS